MLPRNESREKVLQLPQLRRFRKQMKELITYILRSIKVLQKFEILLENKSG